ncbi:MAG: Membrane protein [Candidatus Tokpelaia hoelldobleri]|uniref:Membrane protein n=1 Tax=Candidatus Tokpelaia hoelldobleri TaxID=1902579 RepID=A0A1U9JVN7_9HYPH|nr:MAG: Membrane protein [Candidatus Tokpelaia hoelldoblerii]
MLKPFHLFLGVLTAFLWGLNFVFIQIGLAEVPPLLLSCLRFFFTAVPLVFFLRWPAVADSDSLAQTKRKPVPFRKIAAYSFLMFFCQFTLLFLGMQLGVSAGLSSIILQMQVFVTIALSVVLLHERLWKAQVLGALVAFGGIVLIGSAGSISGEGVSIAGLGMVFLGAGAWGGANLVVCSLGRVHVLSLTVWSALLAVPLLAVMSLVMEGPETIVTTVQHMGWMAWTAVFYQTVFATLCGSVIWSGLLVRYPASMIAPLSLLVPVFGLSCATLLLGEPLPLWKIGAAALVLLGLCINLFGARLKRMPAEDNS